MSAAQEQPVLIAQTAQDRSFDSVVFSPDGKLVAAGDGRTVRLWDVATAKEIRRFEGASGEIIFSPTGTRILTIGDGVRLWDAMSGKEIPRVVGDPRMGKAAVWSTVPYGTQFATFSPDGKYFVTKSNDQLVSGGLWRADTGGLVISYPREKWLSTAAFFPDGKRILIGGIEHAEICDAVSGKEILRLPVGSTGQVAISPDGKRVLTASHVKRELRGAGDKPVVTVRMWDAVKGAELRSFGELNPISARVLFSTDGSLVLTTDKPNEGTQGREWDREIQGRVWDAESGQLIRTIAAADRVVRASFLPGGKHLLEVIAPERRGPASHWDVRVTDVRDGKSAWALSSRIAVPAKDLPSAVASLDGKQVAVTVGAAIDLFDTATGARFRELRGPGVPITAVAVSRDGALVVTGGQDGTTALWDLARGTRAQSFRGGAGAVHAVAVSPDGTRILSASADGVRVWDAATGGEAVRLDGKNLWGKAVAFSSDGKHVLVSGHALETWDAATGKLVRSHRYPLPAVGTGPLDQIESVAFSPDGSQVLRGGTKSGATLWDVESGKQLATFSVAPGVPPDALGVAQSRVAFSADGKRVAATSSEFNQGMAWKIDGTRTAAWLGQLRTGVPALTGPARQTELVAIPPTGEGVLTASREGTVWLWTPEPTPKRPGIAGRANDGALYSEAKPFRGHTSPVTGIGFAAGGRIMVSGGEDTTTRLWDVKTGSEICRLLSCRDGSWAIVTPSGYYTAPGGGGRQALAFRFRDRTFTSEQFDLRFNRPDKVLDAIGLASRELGTAYREAFRHRLKRMNYTESMLDTGFHVPEVTVATGMPLVTREKVLKLRIKASDGKFNLDRVHVDVNGVPVHGANEIDVRKTAARTWDQEVELELSTGENRIDVSVRNEKGAESLRQTFAVQCDAPARKPDLYVVVVGVSDYADARFKLAYADKDARDLADLLATRKGGYGAVKVLRVLNRDATKENILKTSEFLKPCGVDDTVVVFLAGHGVLDANRDYYFGTADIDFREPSKRGLPYSALERILDGARARKKLLLVDTCHSGEVDKEDTSVPKGVVPTDGGVRVVARGGFTLDPTPKVGLRNSFQLMQDLFADLRRGTGAAVVSSAGGAEYALESPEWKNGVFTYAVLRGLKGGADRNKDGKVQVSELRGYVEEEVRRLTGGLQSPTSRSENLLFDFALD